MNKTCKIALPYVRIDDPHLCTDSHALLCIRRLMFPGLLNHNGKTAEGVLCEKWTCENEGKTWTFHLKQGLRFSNGREVRSEDVVYSLHRASSPEIQGQLFTVTYAEYIGGAKLSVIGPYSVRLDNPEPIADLAELLTDLSILPEGWKSYEDGTGAGPYGLESFTGDSAVLKLRSGKNSSSVAGHGDIPGQPGVSVLPERLEFIAVSEPAERLNAVLGSEVSAALDPPFHALRDLEGNPAVSAAGWSSSLSVIFLMQCGAAPFNNIKFRQALNYGVDKDRLIREVMYGRAKPLNGPFSDRHFAHDPSLPVYPHDPEKARLLLKESSLQHDFQLDIHAPTSIPDEGPKMAEFLARSYRSIGLQVEVHLHEDRMEYARQVAEKKLHGLFCFDSSPVSSYKVLHEKLDSRYAGTWWQGYHSERVNTLITQAAASDNDGPRRDLYQQACRILHEEAPWVFLFQPMRFWITGADFQQSLPIDDSGYFKI